MGEYKALMIISHKQLMKENMEESKDQMTSDVTRL